MATHSPPRLRLNEIRIDASRRECDGLRGEVERWVRERTRADTQGQYQTQLAYLGDALTGALIALRAALDAADGGAARGDVAAACRAFDRRSALIRRTWTYFRTKFAQRDDPATAKVLAVADELAWSCHAGVFREAALHADVRQPPAPLPFLDSQETPAAIPRDEPPLELRPDEDDAIVREHLKALAIPVISLPYRCVSDPWWLALVAHEVGHHIQFDLAPDFELVGSFRRRLREAAFGSHAGDERAAREWATWADEVFADACSVCSLGPWALSPIAELELGDARAVLTRRRSRYPPPLVRLALMAEMSDSLGVATTPLDSGIELEDATDGPGMFDGPRDLRAAAAADLRAVPALAAAALASPLPALPDLPRLHGWDTADHLAGRDFRAVVDAWRDGLLDRGDLDPERSLRAPVRVISAAVAAWTELAGESDGIRREEARAALAERLLEFLPRCREEGTRAAEPVAMGDAGAIADELTALLLHHTPHRLDA
jgi:hypothetical protein